MNQNDKKLVNEYRKAILDIVNRTDDREKLKKMYTYDKTIANKRGWETKSSHPLFLSCLPRTRWNPSGPFCRLDLVCNILLMLP